MINDESVVPRAFQLEAPQGQVMDRPSCGRPSKPGRPRTGQSGLSRAWGKTSNHLPTLVPPNGAPWRSCQTSTLGAEPGRRRESSWIWLWQIEQRGAAPDWAPNCSRSPRQKQVELLNFLLYLVATWRLSTLGGCAKRVPSQQRRYSERAL